MLKKLLNSCLDAYRGSHKSVPQYNFISADIVFPTGYPGNEGPWPSYTAPADGICVIQTNDNPSLFIRKRELDFIGSSLYAGAWAVGYIPCQKGEVVNWYSPDTTSATAMAHIRFYPYIGS